ncbi:MAG: ATP-binding cassette domain-containing protein [Flavobacteriaceae bacterium]|nr:ATP-binding cassette domain-containing protein [Flavobacteriaceae bacterium]
MIRIKKISKKYGREKVLDSVTMNLEKGNVYGIVGENGAGKTTLFRCIAGIESHEGEITSEHGILKDHLGLLASEPFFFSKITGKEYIQLLANARNIKLSHIEDKNIFNLPLNKYASTYSTGMKKKLAFMAIMLQKNEVYVLDEPFSGVDIESNMIITQIIKKLKSLDRIVILSSHVFSTLSETCDEIYLLKGGKIMKKVKQKDFERLEKEMKAITIDSQIEKLFK